MLDVRRWLEEIEDHRILEDWFVFSLPGVETQCQPNPGMHLRPVELLNRLNHKHRQEFAQEGGEFKRRFGQAQRRAFGSRTATLTLTNKPEFLPGKLNKKCPNARALVKNSENPGYDLLPHERAINLNVIPARTQAIRQGVLAGRRNLPYWYINPPQTPQVAC